MKKLFSLATIATLALAVIPGTAQEWQVPENQNAKEHDFLKKFVGKWEVISEGDMGDGQKIKGEAVMESTMLGDLWVVNSSEHSVAGMNMKSLQMIGYDTKKKKYIGTWADSMINHLWHYEGTVDESGKKISLNAEGPSMTGGDHMVDYQDAFEFKDDDTIIATSSMKGDDGQWKVIMTGTAKRIKK